MAMSLGKSGRTERKHSEVRQRTEVIAVRLLPGESEILRKAARDRDVSLSELIRRSALEAAAEG